MVLNREEKAALRQKQKLLYSSQQFPLVGGGVKRPRKRIGTGKVVAAAAAAGLLILVALVVLLTRAAA
jgi:hypothetical protein